MNHVLQWRLNPLSCVLSRLWEVTDPRVGRTLQNHAAIPALSNVLYERRIRNCQQLMRLEVRIAQYQVERRPSRIVTGHARTATVQDPKRIQCETHK